MGTTAKSRSEAAKKAAATRKRKADEEAKAAAASNDSSSNGGNNGADGNSGNDAAVAVEQREVQGTEEYRPTRQPLENAGLDQHAAEEKRQAELAAERKVHNERTGDPSLPTGFKY